MNSGRPALFEVWHSDMQGDANGYDVGIEERDRLIRQGMANLNTIHERSRMFVFPQNSFLDFGMLPDGPPDMWEHLHETAWPFDVFAADWSADGTPVRVYVAWDLVHPGEPLIRFGNYEYVERIYLQAVTAGRILHVTGIFGRTPQGAWHLDYLLDLGNVPADKYEEVRSDAPRLMRTLLFSLYGFAQALRHRDVTAEQALSRAQRRQRLRETGLMDGPTYEVKIRPGVSASHVLSEVREHRHLRPGYPKRRHFVTEHQRTYKKTGLTVNVTAHYRGGKRGAGPLYIVDPRLTTKSKP